MKTPNDFSCTLRVPSLWISGWNEKRKCTQFVERLAHVLKKKKARIKICQKDKISYKSYLLKMWATNKSMLSARCRFQSSESWLYRQWISILMLLEWLRQGAEGDEFSPTNNCVVGRESCPLTVPGSEHKCHHLQSILTKCQTDKLDSGTVYRKVNILILIHFITPSHPPSLTHTPTRSLIIAAWDWSGCDGWSRHMTHTPTSQLYTHLTHLATSLRCLLVCSASDTRGGTKLLHNYVNIFALFTDIKFTDIQYVVYLLYKGNFLWVCLLLLFLLSYLCSWTKLQIYFT